MKDDKNMNKRKKSIMIIDKKGQAKELAKDNTSISELIDTTDKTPKDRIISAKQQLNISEHQNTIKQEDFSIDSDLILQNNKEQETILNSKTGNSFNMKDKTNENNNNSIYKNELKESNYSQANNHSVYVEKKTLNMRNAEITAGTAVGVKSIVDITVSRSKEGENIAQKHVVIDEKQNKKHTVEADINREISLTEEERFDIKTKSPLFIPQKIPNYDLQEDSEIKKEREENNVEAEGHIWKRRKIFACFWHEKYFILTKDGFLKYHKANGTKKSKGNWNLKEYRRIHEIFMGGESYPFRLALMNDKENLLFGFDDSDNREYWLTKLSKFININ